MTKKGWVWNEKENRTIEKVVPNSWMRLQEHAAQAAWPHHNNNVRMDMFIFFRTEQTMHRTVRITISSLFFFVYTFWHFDANSNRHFGLHEIYVYSWNVQSMFRIELFSLFLFVPRSLFSFGCLCEYCVCVFVQMHDQHHIIIHYTYSK